jgi:hypothetical protein
LQAEGSIAGTASYSPKRSGALPANAGVKSPFGRSAPRVGDRSFGLPTAVLDDRCGVAGLRMTFSLRVEASLRLNLPS